MQDIFPEYYEPTGDTFKNLWNDCLFVLDTNVLLDLYRVSDESRKDLLNILDDKNFRDRLWLPYQVALEFQRKRLDVIFSKQSVLGRVEAAFTEGLEKLIDAVRNEGAAVNKLNRLQGASASSTSHFRIEAFELDASI